MIYIVIALKSEAQAFVDKYKLNKNRLETFNIFQNDKFTLIVSGLGIKNASSATQILLKYFDIDDNDIFLNIGICGANEIYKIGDLLEISSINYDAATFKINERNGYNLTCLDQEAFEDTYEIVDMESYGFYKALVHKTNNIYVFKVVSDHFEPKKVTKEKTKLLIFNAIENIMQRI